MIRKDRDAPVCQFGIDCNYLRNEVEGSGERCRYFHPAAHYERLRSGRSLPAAAPFFDPLVSRAKVKSFAAPAAAGARVAAAPLLRAPGPAEVAEEAGGAALIVVQLAQGTAVRSGPRFADREVAMLGAGALCCGLRTRLSDGHLEWLELRTGPFFVPLAAATRLAVLARPRFFRVWGARAALRSPAFPGEEGAAATLAEGSLFEVCATVRHGAATLGALAGSHEWVAVEGAGCVADECLAEAPASAVWRVGGPAAAVAPARQPSFEARWRAGPERSLRRGTLVAATVRLRAEHEGRPAGLLRLGGGGGWLPEALCWPLLAPPARRRLAARRELAALAAPAPGAEETGRLAPGEAFAVDCLFGGYGRLADGRGWVPLDTGSAAEREGGEGEGEAEEAGDEGLCVVCMAAAVDCGLLHGDSLHRCCCARCARELTACPVCRALVDRVVAVF